MDFRTFFDEGRKITKREKIFYASFTDANTHKSSIPIEISPE